jgi:hypothetical protein
MALFKFVVPNGARLTSLQEEQRACVDARDAGASCDKNDARLAPRAPDAPPPRAESPPGYPATVPRRWENAAPPMKGAHGGAVDHAQQHACAGLDPHQLGNGSTARSA